MKMTKVFCASMLFLLPAISFAQADRQYNRKAMRAMENGNYNEAILNFQKAIEEQEKEDEYVNNLGHSHFRNEDYENAAEDYNLYKDKSGLNEADQFYNMGNAFLQAGEYDKGIRSYIESLKRNPDDEETKYNLSMAYEMKRQQEQRQQQQDQQDQQNQDNQNQKDKNNKQNDQDKQEQNQPQDQNEDEQENNQNQGQGKQELFREDAERMLEALQKREEDMQEEMKRKAKARQVQPEKDW